MKFEHFAINVKDARAQARWWMDNLGLSAARKRDDEPYTHFLSDETGRVMAELYSNPAAPVPDYAKLDPLILHVAFVSADTGTDRKRLEEQGAVFVSDDTLPDGSRLLMMRDPWGVALQFCQRAKPF